MHQPFRALAACTLLALAAPAAAAQQRGTCETLDLQFEGTEDKGWLAANLQKTFVFQRQADMLMLEYATPGAEPTRTELVVVGDGPLSVTAAMTSVVGLDVFTWEDTADPGAPFEATFSVVAAGFVNTWLLDCRP